VGRKVIGQEPIAALERHGQAFRFAGVKLPLQG
jgi:hypothetical protein